MLVREVVSWDGEREYQALPDPGRSAIGQFSDPSRSGAPETQRMAAISVYPTSGTVRRRVLDFITDAGERGATDEEIEHALRGRHQSISARRNELMKDGWIVDSTRRRATTSGRGAVVWVVSPAGRATYE